MSRPAALVRVLAAVLLLGVVTGGCGVPTGGAPEAIPAADVPAALTARPSPVAGSDVAPTAGQPLVYLVDPTDALVPRGRSVDGDTDDQLADLLDALATGPSTTERSEGLTTALPAQARLTLRDLSGGTATVELTDGAGTATGQQSRRAVAQVVLTVTSLTDVDQVLLTQDGAAVEAPLASGELTTRPLTALDYAGYLTAPR